MKSEENFLRKFGKLEMSIEESSEKLTVVFPEFPSEFPAEIEDRDPSLSRTVYRILVQYPQKIPIYRDQLHPKVVRKLYRFSLIFFDLDGRVFPTEIFKDAVKTLKDELESSLGSSQHATADDLGESRPLKNFLIREV